MTYRIDGLETEYSTLNQAIEAARKVDPRGRCAAPAFADEATTLLLYPDPAGTGCGRIVGETTTTIATVRRVA